MDHASRELEVFHLFLAARGISVGPDAVEKRDPPEPDLLFHHPDGSLIAFELVEIMDEGWAQMMGAGLMIARVCKAYFAELLPQNDRDRFRQKYGNADLSLFFLPDSSARQRRAVVPLLFQKLLDLPDDFAGNAFRGDPAFAGVLDHVLVNRGDFPPGPHFNPVGFAWAGDPSASTLSKKFRKSYVTDHPVELLVYFNDTPMFPADVWRESLKNLLDANPGQQFQKIWVLDCTKCEICFTYP